MNSEETVNIIRKRKEEFSRLFSPTSKVKERVYTVRLKFVPIAHDTESEWEKGRIEENLNLEKGEIVSTLWVKAIEKRRKVQEVGLLMIKLKSPQAANNAMRFGIIIQGKRVRGEKPFYGAPRCFICQGYGHYAATCNKKEEGTVCVNCAGGHFHEQCPVTEKEEYNCINCKQMGHAAWDPYCLTHKAELEKVIKRNTEIQYRFYPTMEEWT